MTDKETATLGDLYDAIMAFVEARGGMVNGLGCEPVKSKKRGEFIIGVRCYGRKPKSARKGLKNESR